MILPPFPCPQKCLGGEKHRAILLAEKNDGVGKEGERETAARPRHLVCLEQGAILVP